MAELVTRLESLMGTDQVIPWSDLDSDLQTQIMAALQAESPPAAMVSPPNQADLAQVLACAHTQGWRILPCGQGSKLDWGGLATGIDLVVSTRRLNQVQEFAAGDLTVTVDAGVRLADLQALLQTRGQFLAIDPLYPQSSTIGGLFATADTGALRQRYGSLRDQVIGISLVRHDGQIAKAGGRVVKNVAGYDMMKLLTGSYGSLGMIAQLTLRTFPRPDASKTVVISGPADAMGPLIAAIKRSALTPLGLDLLSPDLANAIGMGTNLALAAQFQSISAGVEEQVERLLSLVTDPDLTSQVLALAAEVEFWSGLPAQLRQIGPDASTVLAKFGLLPTAAVDFCNHLSQLGTDQTKARIHLGSGIGMARLSGSAATIEALNQLRSQCEQERGYFTLLSAPKPIKQAMEVWGYTGSALALMRAIKHQFDPDRRFSPGRFVGEI